MIYRSTSKTTGFNKIATTSDLSAIDTIIANKTYYYKVKAYVIINGTIYSSGYSNLISTKIER